MAFDLDEFIASQDPGPFEFTFGGQAWVWPPRPDLRAIGFLRDGKIVDAMRMMFRPEDFERFVGETGGGLSEEAILQLVEQHAKHSGSRLGESSGSTTSSKSTAKPRKRTSKSTSARTSARSSSKAAGAA